MACRKTRFHRGIDPYYQRPTPPRRARMSTMNAFHEILGVRSPVEITLNPVNCFVALLHRRVLIVIVALLNNTGDQDFWKKRFPVPVEFESLQPTNNDETLPRRLTNVHSSCTQLLSPRPSEQLCPSPIG